MKWHGDKCVELDAGDAGSGESCSDQLSHGPGQRADTPVLHFRQDPHQIGAGARTAE